MNQAVKVSSYLAQPYAEGVPAVRTAPGHAVTIWRRTTTR